MFLFELIKSEECLRPGTEAHVCAFSSLWLSKSSEGQVLGFNAANCGPEAMGKTSRIPQISETSPRIPESSRAPLESQHYPWNYSNTTKTPGTSVSPPGASRTSVSYQDLGPNLGHSLRTLRHGHIKPRLGPDGRNHGEQLQKAQRPIAHRIPIPALGSLSPTHPHKSSTAPKLQ